MNAVDPIKSLEDIRKMKEFLARKPRNALLFSFGINSGLRISDILALNVGDVRGKEYIEIRELKTGKQKMFPINDKLKQEIEEFTKGIYHLISFVLLLYFVHPSIHDRVHQ